LNLKLSPDEFETKNYKVSQDDYEVEKVNVSKGDRVKAGDIMVQFKADDIQATIKEYTEQKAENELLIEHYQKLMQIDGSEDYSDDIASLKEDIQIADTYIEEQNEKMKEYCLIAEKDGTVTYVNEWLGYGYASSTDNLVTVASGSSNYTATTDDDYEFKKGDVYQADYEVASYDMKVIDVSQYEDKATGKQMQKILFEPVDSMAGISEEDVLTMTIHKPVISNVVYVDEKAINEKSEDNYYVFTINDDGFRTAVDVTIGETVDGYTIIKSGLKAGEQVTVN
jgi:multidrug efflux pump subunit AcrA (membrane-fusion protein)